MEPVARRLAPNGGILEPIQTAITLSGQIEELKEILQQHADLPVKLVGYSWGAWLSALVAADDPRLVEKLILVSSGPFEHRYTKRIQTTRLSRLSEAEGREYKNLVDDLTHSQAGSSPEALARLGALAAKSDAYDPIPNLLQQPQSLLGEPDAFGQALQQALEMRKKGTLLERASRIRCPVTAIHGDYDPHPVAGVQRPLAAVLPDFHLILLEQCGHKPWIERQAKETFYDILQGELF
jgi:pimeloyl-ACP methyl ester carboxylesterase